MNVFYTLFLLLFVSINQCLETGEFMLKSGHYIQGGPVGINSDNVGSILLNNGIQKIPTRLLTPKGLEYFKHLSFKNKDFVISNSEGTKGYEFKELNSFFALNQQKSQANEPIFVYINPDIESRNKMIHFIQSNSKFTSDASYFEKFIFVPKNVKEFDLLKQVMKTEFPSGVILNKNKANEIHSNLATVEDVLELFKEMKSLMKPDDSTKD